MSESRSFGMEQGESAAEKELNQYTEAMENALADLAAEKAANGQPSDVKTVFKESLKIMRAVDSLDTPNIDIDSVQKAISASITILGLDPEKFSLRKVDELAKAAGL